MAVPHTFTDDTPIIAADVNADFAYLDAKIPAQQLIVTASGLTLAVGTAYTFRTGLAAFSATLPALAGVLEGQTLWCLDGDNNAATNNITLTAAGGDTLKYYAASDTTFTLNLSSVGVSFTRSNGTWRVLQVAGS